VLVKNAVTGTGAGTGAGTAALPLSTTANIYVAGSNADNLGNQLGGWSVTWQGGSGNTDVGTTIYQGMQADAPNAHFTYSVDASAPTTGYNVGVVVVGETPYAEGVGDVGNGKTLDLTAADKAAVDKVCAAMKCVVLVVSGRPMNIVPIQAEAGSTRRARAPGAGRRSRAPRWPSTSKTSAAW
jgi:beta-glucosidase